MTLLCNRKLTKGPVRHSGSVGVEHECMQGVGFVEVLARNSSTPSTGKGSMTRRDCEVVDFTRSRVKNNSELTNLMKMYRIEGYNG